MLENKYILYYFLIGTVLTWLFEKLNDSVAEMAEERDKEYADMLRAHWTIALRIGYIVFWPYYVLVFVYSFLTEFFKD